MTTADVPTEADPVRVIEGDCREWLPLLQAAPVAAVITDPPYGIGLTARPDHSLHRMWFRGAAPIAGDDSPELGQAVIDECHRVGWPVLAFAAPLRPWRGDWRQALVWDKGGQTGIGGSRRLCWKQSWELIQVGRFPAVHGDRDEAVLRFPMRPTDWADHPAAKSLKLMRYLVRKLTKPGDLILDPFGGSGTTPTAAVCEGRRCVVIEVDPRYVPVIRRRVRDALGSGLLAFAGGDDAEA